MTENLAAEVCRQVLSTMVYLHSKSYVYKNLHPDVMMLENDEENISDGFNLKLIDIDIQSVLNFANHNFTHPLYYFQAPEAINGPPSERQDVWACGVLLAILLTGKSPHMVGQETSLLVDAITKGSFRFDQQCWKETS
jgi:serine/threonine protein kinase